MSRIRHGKKGEDAVRQLDTETYVAEFTWDGKRSTIAVRANKPFARAKCRRALKRRISGRLSAIRLVRDRNRDTSSSAGMIIAEEVK
jgi:hypothetical protein